MSNAEFREEFSAGEDDLITWAVRCGAALLLMHYHPHLVAQSPERTVEMMREILIRMPKALAPLALSAYRSAEALTITAQHGEKLVEEAEEFLKGENDG